ncbi:DUF6303 family protein [Streptomyces sp. WM6378]|uniref:DUF6303 family protein n=1 Tax=Streptomyces sp. WM6378 TaxID=1415557 RepID=UPI0006ADF63A|nr:DUF6303 family protein [Streptomyces sp. WM6378]KOU53551.1 hypothetical protein ADK54_04165 [Streptomyces sp. WM6378]
MAGFEPDVCRGPHRRLPGHLAISIVLPGVGVNRWPSAGLPVDREIPVRENRARGLDQLGYDLVTLGRRSWEWTEVQDQDSEEVRLVAAAQVRFGPGLADDRLAEYDATL